MKKSTKTILFSSLIVLILVLSGIYLFRTNMVVLNPKGTIGNAQKDLLWISTLLMLIVVLPVFVMTIFIVWRYRADKPKGKYEPNWNHSTLAEIVWWGVPFVIVVILSYLNWVACYDLDPFKPMKSDKKPIEIQVVALQWRWLFIYPEENIATINFIQFPKDTPIHFVITADAPMNSFWIPELGGQIVAMPAMKTELYLDAHEIGDYRGVSANISGEGFASMVFNARASSEEDYKIWLDTVRRSSQALTLKKYKELSKPIQNSQVMYFAPVDKGLFDQIVQMGMMPDKEVSNAK
jgi:cytochrome o ubiquinol oxidase subunit 2